VLCIRLQHVQPLSCSSSTVAAHPLDILQCVSKVVSKVPAGTESTPHIGHTGVKACKGTDAHVYECSTLGTLATR
jgi:hypothetical protein